jgi:hypothetical protein
LQSPDACSAAPSTECAEASSGALWTAARAD